MFKTKQSCNEIRRVVTRTINQPSRLHTYNSWIEEELQYVRNSRAGDTARLSIQTNNRL